MDRPCTNLSRAVLGETASSEPAVQSLLGATYMDTAKTIFCGVETSPFPETALQLALLSLQVRLSQMAKQLLLKLLRGLIALQEGIGMLDQVLQSKEPLVSFGPAQLCHVTHHVVMLKEHVACSFNIATDGRGNETASQHRIFT